MKRLIFSCGVAAVLAGCDARPKSPTPPAATPAPAAPAQPAAPASPAPAAATKGSLLLFEEAPVSTIEGVATWYSVRDGSLPERRAPGEFTAAYDRLPLGSYARITSKENGSVVIVCITDAGVGKRRGIDLCKEAAEELGIVQEGEGKVRIEALRERKDLHDVPKEKAR